ncbi:hypothetical protein Cni_G16861 [Canna indica]|uniref:Uncharacterized protein n=1 Tax=Canna indica TaxID=4628 RepID=A0AAQ3KFW5_9LILI|nr:hypothetical protein Cni_G16861 [Canna indica]
MVRAPCCEKMGMKKGPWTAEEDQVLASYINKYGHVNWRALPKQAGLLRCGKSCRLRWMNYLRPDIKRGNFTKEEEETIINLHGILGNRWSAIAAKLPGRTDNEIKNVWHTHLKKLLSPNQPSKETKRKIKSASRNNTKNNARMDTASIAPISPARSFRELSSCATDSPSISTETGSDVCTKEGSFCSSDEFLDIDETFWLDALSMDDSAAASSMDFTELETAPPCEASQHFSLLGSSDDDMDFWRRVFVGAGDVQELSQIQHKYNL